MKTLTRKCSEKEVQTTKVYRKLYSKSMKDIWVKVFKNGPSKICGRQSICLSGPYHFKFFKGCLLQILLGPSLNTLTSL